MGSPTVAIIGAGVTGLAALKNTLEEGFDATAFESRDTIGGIWKYTAGEDLSVLETTVSNKSRFKNSFTDFPYPKGSPHFPTAPQVCEYLESYAKEFDLLSHIRLQTRVLDVTRNGDDTKWTVRFQQQDGSETAMDFDKVAICRGEWGAPKIPTFAGRELFQGEIIHTQSFKRPSDFEGKTVVVLGLGNNAADISTALLGHASKIYLAHRRGANLLPRNIDGKPGDLAVNRRLLNFKYSLNAISPALSEGFFNQVIQSLTKKAFALQPSWRIHPAPSFLSHQPTVSDDLVSHLSSGAIISAHSIARFTGPRTIELSDGSTLDNVDAVICCTGFIRSFALVPELAPSGHDTWSAQPNSDGQPLPRLFQNIFPVERADSIAFLNNFTYPTGYMWIADLASMAVAQVWKGTSALPPVDQMNAQIDAHHAWLNKMVRRETIASNFVQEESWLRWCHDAAGTGINENLGYRGPGWKFWAREWNLSGLLMGGVETPFALRLFEGKRRRWEGARQAIIDVNEEVK